MTGETRRNIIEAVLRARRNDDPRLSGDIAEAIREAASVAEKRQALVDRRRQCRADHAERMRELDRREMALQLQCRHWSVRPCDGLDVPVFTCDTCGAVVHAIEPDGKCQE